VIESRQIVTGVSGHTTAKITSLHQLIYADLIKQIGEQKARVYAESNQAAIEFMASLVAKEQKVITDLDNYRTYGKYSSNPHFSVFSVPQWFVIP
jgi:hypothetical protein